MQAKSNDTKGMAVRSIDPRSGRRLGVSALISLVLMSPLWAPTPAAAVSAPAGLEVADVANTGVGLVWSPVDDAALYRVRMSTSSSMASPRTIDVPTPYYDWSRIDPNPAGAGTRLSPDTTYYFQVKALTASRGDLSGYSKAVSATTRSGAETTLLPPERVRTSVAGTTSLYVSWATRGPGVHYRLRYSTSNSSDVNSWDSADFTVSGGVLTGLEPGTSYYLRVRVLSTGGDGLSDYSDAVKATTPESMASPRLTIASYNILKTGPSPSWASRRSAVIAGIKSVSPDILALQEALPTKVTGASGAKVPQYTDVLQMLGNRYQYVTTQYSSGTHLAYNPDRLTVLRSGSQKLWTLGSSPRYAVWAVMEDKVSGKRLFVVDTHLEPSGSNASKSTSARARQAREILALIKTQNSSGHPVVVAGDMNSSRASKPSNAAYATFTGGGLVDPHGNANATYVPTTPSTEHMIDAAYNSYNNMERRARRTIWTLGTSVDYIFFSPGIRVALTRTVVNVDGSGHFIGTIPSDHNMLLASFHLA